MMRELTPILLIVLLVSCPRVDVFIKENKIPTKPDKILIGYFEKRNLSFDPFIAKNFRDALRFDLFKRGYKVQLLSLPITGEAVKESP